MTNEWKTTGENAVERMVVLSKYVEAHANLWAALASGRPRLRTPPALLPLPKSFKLF